MAAGLLACGWWSRSWGGPRAISGVRQRVSAALRGDTTALGAGIVAGSGHLTAGRGRGRCGRGRLGRTRTMVHQGPCSRLTHRARGPSHPAQDLRFMRVAQASRFGCRLTQPAHRIHGHGRHCGAFVPNATRMEKAEGPGRGAAIACCSRAPLPSPVPPCNGDGSWHLTPQARSPRAWCGKSARRDLRGGAGQARPYLNQI